MLIENNFIKFEEIIINVIKKKIYINNYKTFITITSRQREQFIKKKVYAFSTTKILSYNENLISIFISLSLLKDRNYFFESIKQFNVIFFTHIMNNRIIIILIKNNFDHQIEISRKFKLEIITKFDYKNCF